MAVPVAIASDIVDFVVEAPDAERYSVAVDCLRSHLDRHFLLL